MGKRSDFAPRKNDAYLTWDRRAVPPLLPYLSSAEFVEPCAGEGHLIDQLEGYGLRCVQALDVEPGRVDIEYGDARTLRVAPGRQVITNPPWSRPLLHAIIDNLAPQVDAWLLFDSDWLFTQQSGPYRRHLHLVVPVGRLRWVENTPHDAVDSCAWYLFGPNAPPAPIIAPYVRRDLTAPGLTPLST